MKYQLCFEDDLKPVEWIDHPDLKVPLFESKDEAFDYLAQHGVFDQQDLKNFCYTLVAVPNPEL